MKKYFFGLLFFAGVSLLNGKIINVPTQHASISEALSVSSAGDTIIVKRGIYKLSTPLNINKAVTIASNYIFSNDETDIDNTIIVPLKDKMHEWFELSAKGSKVTGFKFEGNKHHILNITASYAYVTHCKFFGGKDQLSFSGGGGYVGYCYFENAGDDALDCDNSISWTIEHNTIVNAHQDGIEIRLHPKNAPMTIHHFNNNRVIAAGESGIQLIDYKGNSYREFYIHNNIFEDCRGSGVSCMYKEKDNTNEVYRGSLMEESAFVYNNTFVGCNYGLTISPGLLVLNNIFTGIKTKAVGRGIYVNDGNDKSIVDYSLFYNNKSDFDNGIITGKNNLIAVNPMLNSDYTLKEGSPCIDKGIAVYNWEGKSFDIPKTKFNGKAPDIGAFEFGTSRNELKKIPVINIGKDVVIVFPQKSTELKGTMNDIALEKEFNYSWKKVSGNGKVEFSNPEKIKTKITFEGQGVYEIMLTATNGIQVISDIATVYFVNDFKDKKYSVDAKKPLLIEGENYRYLVGDAKVATLNQETVITAEKIKTPSFAQYEISTKTSGAFYVWIKVTGKNGKLSVALNDLKNEKEIKTNNKKNFVWEKVKFSNIPEGIYPLRVKIVKEGIAWDKIFITTDANEKPNKK